MSEAFKALPKSSLDHKRGSRESGKKKPKTGVCPTQQAGVWGHVQAGRDADSSAVQGQV